MRLLVGGVAGLCALAALLTQFPASWAGALFLPDAIKQQAKLSGTIWNGRLTGIEGAGPVQFQVFPSKLLGNAPAAQFYSQVPGLQISGGARPGQLSDVVARGRISTFSNLDDRLSGLAGTFELTLDKLTVDQGCSEASGAASSNVLAVNSALLQWQGPDLSGPISCENGELVLRLSGLKANDSVDVTLRSALAGVYTVNMQIKTDEAMAASVLPLYGFERRGQIYVLEETGTWN